MKKISIIMMFVATFAFSSCGLLGGASNVNAVSSGAACGSALVSLNNSKKAGTLSITNPTDLSNILIVISSYNSLKNNKDNSSFIKSFATGMVTGGAGDISSAAATQLTNSLLSATGLDGVNASNVSQSVQTVSTIVQLLTLLNQ